MKDKDTPLSRQETEELCRLYMDCQLSVLEERELQYILGRLSYTSPVIEEARNLMIAEGIVFSEKKKIEPKKNRFFRKHRIVQIAASLIMLLSLSVLITRLTDTESRKTDSYMARTEATTAEEIVIAYEGGRKLSPTDSEKAVSESLKKAEALMAMAESREKEDEIKQRYILNLTSGMK